MSGGGGVPAGCVVHHLDWDKSHNVPENLVCLTHAEHEQVHNIIGGEAGKRLGYELAAVRNTPEGQGIAGLEREQI